MVTEGFPVLEGALPTALPKLCTYETCQQQAVVTSAEEGL